MRNSAEIANFAAAFYEFLLKTGNCKTKNLSNRSDLSVGHEISCIYFAIVLGLLDDGVPWDSSLRLFCMLLVELNENMVERAWSSNSTWCIYNPRKNAAVCICVVVVGERRQDKFRICNCCASRLLCAVSQFNVELVHWPYGPESERSIWLGSIHYLLNGKTDFVVVPGHYICARLDWNSLPFSIFFSLAWSALMVCLMCVVITTVKLRASLNILLPSHRPLVWMHLRIWWGSVGWCNRRHSKIVRNRGTTRVIQVERLNWTQPGYIFYSPVGIL